MGDKLIDALVGLLYEVDGLAKQAFLEGYTGDKSVLLTILNQVSEVFMRTKLCAIFIRLISLMMACTPGRPCPSTVDAVSAYKLAHVLLILVDGVKGAVQYIRDEYEEELTYVLANPEVAQRLAASDDFFINKARPLVQQTIELCLRG